jgi:hypothetical protein
VRLRAWIGPALIVLEPLLLGATILYCAKQTIAARSDARAARSELAAVQAKLRVVTSKPTTPEDQLRHFIEHCNESMVWLDLKTAPHSCSERPEGDGVSGRMIVCAFRQSGAPGEPPGFVVCDKTGCSWSVRNGVGP